MNFEREIGRAAKHLDCLAETDSLDEFTSSWEDFLVRLELLWERFLRGYGNEPWFSAFQKPWAELRRTDPLLIYLKQARNAETHTLEGTLNSSLQMLIRDRSGKPFSLSSAGARLEDGTLTIDLESQEIGLDLDASIGWTHPIVAAFKCRGVWYKLPHSHLRKPLRSKSPAVVGRLALDFYSGLLRSAAREAHNKRLQQTGASAGR